MQWLLKTVYITTQCENYRDQSHSCLKEELLIQEKSYQIQQQQNQSFIITIYLHLSWTTVERFGISGIRL